MQKISIEGKIEKAQDKVVRSKDRYDVAVAELRQLIDKKDAMMKDALLDAITRSDKSYDEILVFLTGNTTRRKAG